MRPPDDARIIPDDAQATTSGIAYQVLVPGSGPTPGPYDWVEARIAAWTLEGDPVEALAKGGEVQSLRIPQLDRPGLVEALSMVEQGGTTRFWIPGERLASKTPLARPEQTLPAGTLLVQITVTGVTVAPLPPPDVAAPPPDAIVTGSGLITKVLVAGTGTVHPDAHDRVTVHYSGWTTDGEVIDSSRMRGQPSTLRGDQVIQGWTEGLQRMVVGETTRFWIPEALAYKGLPGRPAGMLVFDIELLEIDERPAPPAVPKDVAKPPRRARRTRSGLAYRRLTRGEGSEHPSPTSTVTVHYSGWTTDGTMFDSSVTRGRPTSLPLDRVIEGWTEALQLMVVGDKTRFWIPEALAYERGRGRPEGMLVFDIELLAIER